MFAFMDTFEHSAVMSDRENALRAIQQMPDDATFGDIASRIRFLTAVQKGLNEIKLGEVVPHNQVKKKLASWFSN
jgi:predicted transcriptional regulator